MLFDFRNPFLSIRDTSASIGPHDNYNNNNNKMDKL